MENKDEGRLIMRKYRRCEFYGNMCMNGLCGFDNPGECDRRNEFLTIKWFCRTPEHLQENLTIKYFNEAFEKIREILSRKEYFSTKTMTDLNYSGYAIATKKLLEIDKIIYETLKIMEA